MSVPKTVGRGFLSASGRSINLYEGQRFIGSISLVDVDRCRKSKNFAASIIKYVEVTPTKTLKLKEAEPEKLNYFLNLF